MKVSLNHILVLLLNLIIFWGSNDIIAQDYQQITEVPVFKDGKQLKSAWAGGVNAPQFNEVDLNNDGRKDLFLYDKDAKRYLTFIHVNADEYIYEPSYALNFPAINSWVVIADYNCDGIADLFTHNRLRGCPKAFKGYYENDVLKFEFDKDEVLYASSSGTPFNLYTVSTHRPLFKDVNGDGDRDFLSFNVNLNRIYYYENLRVENNIPCDSIYFDRIDACWGNVKETGGLSLDLLLNDTCGGKFARLLEPAANNRHPGGTVFDIYDENKDGVFDIILGDATYERINYLKNNGTIEYASIYEQDDSFPSYDQQLSMPIFPAPYVMDIDKDGDEDIVVAPFLAGVVDNYKNVWLYENNGSDFEPFRKKQEDFLVGDMIDVGQSAAPTFFDYNNDGLLDLVIGNDGYFEDDGEFFHSLTLFKNTGSTAAPVFEFVTNNFLNISNLDLQATVPYFADIDNDGDKDLFLGEDNGKIVFLKNNNSSFENAAYLRDNNNIEIDIGQNSSPILYDFDGNNTLDLIIGCRNGNIYYYENTGTQSNYQFTLRTDSLGKITSRGNQLFGHSSPSIGDFDGDGLQDLLLGGFTFGTKFYSNIGTDYSATFSLDNDNFFNAYIPAEVDFSGVDPRLKVTSEDISGDGKPEVLIGINNGGISFYSQDENIADTSALNTDVQILNNRLSLFPNPAKNIVRIDLNNSFDKNSPIKLTLFNIIGETVLQQLENGYDIIELNIEDLNRGIYLINLKQNNKIGTLKLIKN